MTNQQAAPEALADPSPDQLRAIARSARNSSGSASDDCGPPAYVLHGWRAAAIAFRAQQATLVDAQQPAAHVQNPAEIEHVAGDVSKNGAESNMSTQQTAPATQKLKEQICISDTNQSAACAVGSVGTTSDAQTTRSTHDAPATQHASRADADAARLALPELTVEDRLLLHYNPNTGDIVKWVRNYARAAITADRAGRAPTDSVLDDAARWQWLADYLIGERTDFDDGIVACATIDALRQFVDAARKQGANHE